VLRETISSSFFFIFFPPDFTGPIKGPGDIVARRWLGAGFTVWYHGSGFAPQHLTHFFVRIPFISANCVNSQLFEPTGLEGRIYI